jgi:hypothetical protein
VGSGDRGRLLVEELRDEPAEPRFRLPSQPQKNDVMLGEQRVDDLRQNAVIEADDPREDAFASSQLPQ